MELHVEPQGRSLTFEAGANLLDTLRANDVPVSYSCMSGRCGTCRCKVLDGDVLESGREITYTRPRGDTEGRYVLACMSVLTQSCRIEVPEADEVVTHPARILKATVAHIDPLAHDIIGLRLKSAKPLAFSPGQYATLQFSPDHIRPYSMAGVAGDELLEFHVRKVPDGRVTGYVHTDLKVGDTVRVSGPLGTAYLRRRHEGPMLCVAGGTGLAPVLSIVRGALAGGMTNPIHVYFGVRSVQDVYCAERLSDLAARHANLRTHIVVAAGAPGAGMRGGWVTDAVDQDWQDLTGWRVYLCGAPPMVEAAALLAARKGAAPEHIHADAFYAAA
ncbi:2Fe-2S iron-sulfur cluster-binding protein [Pigmentiphaga litoralis]|uniref:Ferredoxin-NAD(P)+ reductase (Naphthalene dioxygenase ferredoxin-specific) n=1 Tax=Pigmentiphaga litoralis TaxID=516702 RepID=A0A7Y9IW49_9BURK|nr:2Fe-2S iron-sulfur cluster-binding protein [Pigmentiphaga litoralis]NYE22316.1 ferredoxin-NAD(P)+ reductase (naphthalene dioxygenase ferredoxin-specific) [Pigmentiphaga litoralis]NYE84069.1 ferredoxin-NAD(P)+ reductase (naphthalene dioxygenase ferredoxin-specific) [Pigmentiphaga litoralis]